jgi:hypothetical protein
MLVGIFRWNANGMSALLSSFRQEWAIIAPIFLRKETDMKQVLFAVNHEKSFVKNLGWRKQKPEVQGPIIENLINGGSISLTIDDSTETAYGQSNNLYFYSDKFAQDSYFGINGNLQKFKVSFPDLNMEYDPQTGDILSGSVNGVVLGPADTGGATLLTAFYKFDIKPAFLDGNSNGFDVSNGLGCGGGLIFEIGVGNTDSVIFIIHIEAIVSAEDVDDDGNFETVCPAGLRKEFHLDYEPPKLKLNILFPERGMQRFQGFNNVEAVRLKDLLKQVVKNPRDAEVAKIESIELVNAPGMLVIFMDPKGRVYGGGISRQKSTSFKIPWADVKELLIGFVPTLGMSVDDL